MSMYYIYEAGKGMSTMQRPVDWREIFMKQSVGKLKKNWTSRIFVYPGYV